MASKRGRRPRPRAERAYSTGAGLPGRTVRVRMPSPSRAEALGEDFFADAGAGAEQGAEAGGAGEDQLAQDEEFPLAADKPDRDGDGAGREFRFLHHFRVSRW